VTATPAVLVTDAARGSAVSIIRSLGRRGFRVVAADSVRRSPGFYSRYTTERFLYPDPSRAPEEFVDAMYRAVRDGRIDLVIPVTDDVIVPLARARDRFAPVTKLAVPEEPARERAADKLETIELAERLGIPVPRTQAVEDPAEAVDAAPDLGWPVVVKPRVSRLYRNGAVSAFEVAYAPDALGLAQVLRRMNGSPVLLQEYRPGTGHGVELLTHRGRLLAAFQHRRLHEVPISGGASALRESVPLDPVLLEHSLELLRALDWTGLAMVEFRVAGGAATLMEVNGRIWGSLPLAVKCGVDFPAKLAQLHLKGPPDPQEPPAIRYPVGVRSRNLDLEVAWIASVLRRRRRYPFLASPSRREALRAAARLPLPADGYDVLCRDDSRPGLAEALVIGKKLVRKARAA
jgi:predicted ATP-grasp superfamily ATP-dependent carboligase